MVIQLQAQNIFFKNQFRYDCVATRPAKNNIKPKSTKRIVTTFVSKSFLQSDTIHIEV